MFTLAVTPNMKLRATIKDGNQEMDTVLTVGHWATVYVLYSFTAGGYGIAKVYVNEGPAGGLAATSNAPNIPTIFSSTLDTLKIGGGFVGHLKRFQVYSPAALPFIASTGDSNRNLLIPHFNLFW